MHDTEEGEEDSKWQGFFNSSLQIKMPFVGILKSGNHWEHYLQFMIKLVQRLVITVAKLAAVLNAEMYKEIHVYWSSKTKIVYTSCVECPCCVSLMNFNYFLI